MSSITKTLFGKRRFFLLSLVALFYLSIHSLDLQFSQLIPNEYGSNLIGKFFSTALQPATNYQNGDIPLDAPPYYTKILGSLFLTLKYATCAISLALIISIPLGFFGSKSWWSGQKQPKTVQVLLNSLYFGTRIIMSAGRSIHEVLWALLFISAMGTSAIAAIAALAIPYGCTLGKVFSELLDEQSSHTKSILESKGSSSIKAWFFGTLTPAIPDLLSYALYRYECSIRSAAILGFVGIETIGYHIETAMEDANMNEVWTLLYALLATILIVERISYFIRKKITQPVLSKTNKKVARQVSEKQTFSQLKKNRPRDYTLIILTLCSLIAIAASWLIGESLFSTLSFDQRMTNLSRFLSKEILPEPVQQSGNWSGVFSWAKSLFVEHGFTSILQTLAIATAAMTLAHLTALITLPLASKKFNKSKPFGIFLARNSIIKALRTLFSSFIRILFILSRAMPEYLLAYLLLRLLGPTAWPLILGLAIHNFGIIGRLGGELIDNSTLHHTGTLLSQGATRNSSYLFSILPTYFNRFCLYFFYRWETCIRDATILGYLGIASLGFLISDSRARDHYDQMFFYIILGAATVMAGDLLSEVIRRKIRN